MEHSNYSISTEQARFDVGAIHAYLTRSYWAADIPMDVVARAIENSLCFGVFHGAEQVGFARVITDKATFAYLADVYILEAHRGNGLAKQLLRVIQRHPALQGLRRFLLATKDAHGLYRQFGFSAPAKVEFLMEIADPDVYRRKVAVRNVQVDAAAAADNQAAPGSDSTQ